jgi:hypothetical protein
MRTQLGKFHRRDSHPLEHPLASLHPYGGVSPVRLQTGIPPRPSLPRRSSSVHPRAAYTRFKSRSPKRASSRSRTGVQAALSPSDRTLPSRGPGLAGGFGCPARSMLTMTSTQTLGPSRPLRSSPTSWTWAERFPHLLCLSLSSLPSSVPRHTGRLPVPSSSALAFPLSVGGRRLHSPRAPVPAWPCNEAAKFALGYGPEESLALHRPGRLPSSFHLLSRLKKASSITTRVNQPIPAAGLTPARQAALWAANRAHRAWRRATR